MIVPGETFPYAPLSPQEQTWIVNLCGGMPVDNPEYVRNFLSQSGYVFLGTTLVRTFFDTLALRSAQALDKRPAEEAARAFNRGLLFYAGVASEATHTSQLPYEEPVMGHLADADPVNLALGAYQDASARELASFRELLEVVRPALNLGDDRMYQMALAGAGVLHRVVIESAGIRSDNSPATLSQAHPELADLDALWNAASPFEDS